MYKASVLYIVLLVCFTNELLKITPQGLIFMIHNQLLFILICFRVCLRRLTIVLGLGSNGASRAWFSRDLFLMQRSKTKKTWRRVIFFVEAYFLPVFRVNSVYKTLLAPQIFNFTIS